jgi:cyclopropane fatty-acyl-phospholipid synthase-like methyltransferase
MARNAEELQERSRNFSQQYDKARTRAELLVEREVHGTNARINSYTTVAQADILADVLGLAPGVRLLDVGAGFGWPSLYLAERTGCDVLLTDVPATAMRSAAAKAAKQRLTDNCSFALASGAHLPFRPRSFDAIVQSDVL